MICIHKVDGLEIDAALPKLIYTTKEAKIASIPGWRVFSTPHPAWLDPATNVLTERSHGNRLAPATYSASDRNLVLGTLDNGLPCFNLGLESSSAPYPYSGVTMPDDVSFFVVAKGNGLSAQHHLLRMFESDQRQDREYFDFFINASGFLTVLSKGGSTVLAKAEEVTFDDINDGLWYALLTYSVANGAKIYFNGADATTYHGTVIAPLDTDNRPLFFAYNPGGYYPFKGQIACFGLLGVDLSLPENEYYRAALDDYVLSTYPIGTEEET